MLFNALIKLNYIMIDIIDHHSEYIYTYTKDDGEGKLR